ncbi:MAG: DNA polymerase III subunit delta' [Magnetococcus sp. DMHC-8]
MIFLPTLEQIVGHAAVLANLRRAMASHHPGHAHLFFGPPGVGKATVAGAFVQALFCPRRGAAGDAGCGECPTCRKVAQGNHGDLIRVTMEEGKTRIGVDQVRQLAGFFALTPMEAPWKVAIMDDAASMNEAAANALLKTLEEPPPRSLLILVTRQAGRLLPTIRSRCLKTRFSQLAPADLRRILGAGPGGEAIAALDETAWGELVAVGGGNAGRIVAFSQGEWPGLRSQFRQEMAGLPSVTLGRLLSLAERWSPPERFALVTVLLRAWLRERVQAVVLSQPDRSVPGGGVPQEEWLKVASWVEQLLQQTAVINLNRRLVLEAVFIRLARLQGVSF